MILPNGRCCVIRERYANAGGHLVVEAEYWDGEAEHIAAPDHPHASHDHEFCTKNGAKIDPADPHVGDFILSVLNGVTKADRNLSCRPHPRGEDKCDWLKHPHVAALEVTPR